MTIDLKLPRVLHVLIHLSLRERIMSSAEIANMLATNPVVVRRMLAGLRESGLIEATKGRSGGWRVSKPLTDISVADVFEALGRPGWSDRPVTNDHPGCPVEGAVNQTIAKVEAEAVMHVLTRYGALSLSDIARDVPPSE